MSFKPENEYQLKADLDAVKSRVVVLEDLVEQLMPLIRAVVTFDSDGGSSVDRQFVPFGEKASKPSPDPTKANYRFNNWYDGSSVTPFDFENTAILTNKTLTAHWDALYTVTYSLNEGTGTLPTHDPCIAGETFTLASSEGITKEGKVFGGWNDGTETYEAGATYTMGSANVTLTAVWNDPV